MEVEAVARRGELQLVEEHLRERVEPMLTRVQHDLADAGVPECGRQRRGLDELGSVPDDSEDLHA